MMDRKYLKVKPSNNNSVFNFLPGHNYNKYDVSLRTKYEGMKGTTAASLYNKFKEKTHPENFQTPCK